MGHFGIGTQIKKRECAVLSFMKTRSAVYQASKTITTSLSSSMRSSISPLCYAALIEASQMFTMIKPEGMNKSFLWDVKAKGQYKANCRQAA